MTEAADKLARTRLAIIAHVHGRERHHDDQDTSGVGAGPGQQGSGDGQSRGPSAWFASVRRGVGTWWRQHPAHTGVDLATPLLSAFAKRKPAQFLGIAAVAGALFVITRPWRLISVTGLIVALAKSSQLSSMVMSAMSAADFQKDHQIRR